MRFSDLDGKHSKNDGWNNLPTKKASK